MAEQPTPPTAPATPPAPATPSAPGQAEPAASGSSPGQGLQDVIRQLREAPVIDNQVTREVHLSEEAVKAMIEALEHAGERQPSARSQAARSEERR
jgi:hypothetical protein